MLTGLTGQGIKSFIIYINLASTYVKLGRYEEALTAAEKARSFNLKATQPVLLMGESILNSKSFKKPKMITNGQSAIYLGR